MHLRHATRDSSLFSKQFYSKSNSGKGEMASQPSHDGVTLLEMPCADGHPCQTLVDNCYFMSHFSCIGYNKRCDNTTFHITDRIGVLYFVFFDAVCTLCTNMQAWTCSGNYLYITVVSCCLFLNPEREIAFASRSIRFHFVVAMAQWQHCVTFGEVL